MHNFRTQYLGLALFALIFTSTIEALPVEMGLLAAKRSTGSTSVISSAASSLVSATNRRRRHSAKTSTGSSILTSATFLGSQSTPASVALPPTATGNTTTSSSGGNGTNPAGTSNSLGALFPVPNSGANWTTLLLAPGALPLSDATFRPFAVESGTTHNYVSAPDGKMSMEAIYPKGSYIPSKEPRGGFSFYAPGPESVDFTTASELTFGYSVMFPQGFQFVKGGKLPGIYGGDNATTAKTCSGGRRDPTCFSARLMWRPEGAGELYTYLPDSTEGPQFAPNEAICKLPNSTCNPTYGASLGRGTFTFATGEWTTVSERVKLNTAGQADGELELFVGGKSVISVTGIILRDTDEGRMRGMQMQTFFGGSTPDWASPVDQQVYFADFSVAIISTL